MDRRGQRASEQFLLNGYSFLLLFYKDNGRQPYPWPSEPMDQQTMQWVLIRSMQTEIFVLAHEMSHVMLEHPLASPSASSPTDREELVRQSELSKMQEHEADVFGYILYLNAWKRSEFAKGNLEAVDFFVPLEYLALRFLIERNPETVPPRTDPTHPTAAERAQVILSRLAGMELDEGLRRELISMTDGFSRTFESTPNMVRYFTSLSQWIERGC